MRDPEVVADGPAVDQDIEDELLSSCRESSFGFTALDHLREPSPTLWDAVRAPHLGPRQPL